MLLTKGKQNKWTIIQQENKAKAKSNEQHLNKWQTQNIKKSKMAKAGWRSSLVQFWWICLAHGPRSSSVHFWWTCLAHGPWSSLVQFRWLKVILSPFLMDFLSLWPKIILSPFWWTCLACGPGSSLVCVGWLKVIPSPFLMDLLEPEAWLVVIVLLSVKKLADIFCHIMMDLFWFGHLKFF